jgi:hypothetical protein
MWTTYDSARPIIGAIYSAQRVRMLAFGLPGGGLCVVSPGSGVTDADFTELETWGKPRFLLAPNHFHNGGLRLWHERYPDAAIVAHPRAIARLSKRLGLPVADLTALRAVLPPDVRLLSPPMAKQGETWVAFGSGQGATWYVCDGILNESRLPSGPLGMVMRALGFRTELMTNPLFKRLFLASKAGYKAWVLEQLTLDPPTRLIPAHGAVLEGADLAEKLRRVTEAA